MKHILSLIIILVFLVPFNVPAKSYKVDPSQVTIQFKVKNMGIMNVKGVFEKFKGTIDIDETDITKSKVDVTIEMSSINTGINKRDNHLRSSDFLDVAKFPTMTFVSTKVEAGNKDKEKLKVTGNLKIKEVTKQVTLLVDGPKNLEGDFKLEFSAFATVNRQDFGISSGAVIGDEVFITINTELFNQSLK